MESRETRRTASPADSGGLPPEVAAGLSPERRRIVRHCLVLMGLLGAGSLIGSASVLYLASHAPLLLIALSPLGRHLILVAPVVSPVAFITVAVIRRAAFYIPCFFLGRALGPQALHWLESRSPRWAHLIRGLERLFRRASYPVVFLLPGPAMSTIAGDSGMRARVFIPILIAGLILRMAVVLWIGDWLRGPIEAVLAWIRAYWLPGTLLILTGLAVHSRWRHGREGAPPA